MTELLEPKGSPGESTATAVRPAEKSRYVIQRQNRDDDLWEDAVVMYVAKKTRRTSVLLQAMADKQLSDVRPTDHFRVLDEEQARVLKLEPELPATPSYRVVQVED